MTAKLSCKLNKKYWAYWLLILNISLLNGCSLYKDLEAPCTPTPDHFKSALKTHNKLSKIKKSWWENFNDPKLNALVEKGIKNNYDYKISIKNIDIAKTYVNQNLSNLFPQANLNFNSTRNKTAFATLTPGQNNPAISSRTPNFSSIFNLQQLSASVSYELDIWNQIRNSVKQAKANQAVSEATSQVVKLSLITNIVDGYFQIVALNSKLNNLKKQLQLTQEMASLAGSQLQGGLIDASSLYTTRNQVETIKSNINDLEKQKQIMINTLAYLVGEYPENFVSSFNNEFKNFQIKNLIPVSIPSEMLANRPDIQSAFYQVLSYGYLEKQTLANFLPNINLTGNYGYSSNALSNLISGNNAYWSYGGYLSQFLFDYKNRISQYKRSQHQYESAILSYRATVLNAFKEVDSALSSYQQDNEALFSFQKQTANLNDLRALSKAQYQSGLGGYSSYLTSHLNYLQSCYNLTSQKLLVIEDVLQAYKSLAWGLEGC